MTQHLTPLLNDLAVERRRSGDPARPTPTDRYGAAASRAGSSTTYACSPSCTVSVAGSDLELVRSRPCAAPTGRSSPTSPGGSAAGSTTRTVTLDRRRTLTAAGLVEEIEVASRGQEPVELALHVDLVADLAPMAAVRQGLRREPVAAEATADGLAWRHDGRGFAVAFDPAPDAVGEGGRLTWTAHRRAGRSRSRSGWTFAAEGTPAFGPGGTAALGRRTAVERPGHPAAPAGRRRASPTSAGC